LNWALAGFDDWFLGGLGLPDAVDLATAEYRAEQDVVGQFLDAVGYRCASGMSTPAGELRSEYGRWAEANAAVVPGPVAFANALRSRGLRDVRRNRGRFWEGVGRVASSLPLTSEEATP
jgi:putative DNA primase/helicase